MHKKSIKLNGVRVLGTTLWSDVCMNCYEVLIMCKVPPQEEQGVLRGLNDYHMIAIQAEEGKFRKLHVKDTNKWFKEEVEWV